MTFPFAVIGINHNHIYGQVNCLLAAGASFASYFAQEEALVAPFAAAFPQAVRLGDKRRILEDARIKMVLTSGVPVERAALAIEAMRHGKDFMSDKPGMTTLEQLADVRRVQRETARLYSVCYSEHFETASTVKAGELVHAGAIGQVVHTTGLGPHRLNKPLRPEWFFQRQRYGGILCDIAAHQCEQFLFFADAMQGEVTAAHVYNRNNPATPELQDVGEMMLRTGNVSGYVNVHWFTPDGLSTWGDGRLVIVGTEGTIELRKYVDVAGRPGKDHLFLTDGSGMRYVDCAGVDLPYGRALVQDVLNRTETAMPQERCFNAMELALKAQAMAEARGAH